MSLSVRSHLPYLSLITVETTFAKNFIDGRYRVATGNRALLFVGNVVAKQGPDLRPRQ